MEFAQIVAVLVVVESLHVVVEPNLASAEGRASVRLQADAEDVVLGELIAL